MKRFIDKRITVAMYIVLFGLLVASLVYNLNQYIIIIATGVSITLIGHTILVILLQSKTIQNGIFQNVKVKLNKFRVSFWILALIVFSIKFFDGAIKLILILGLIMPEVFESFHIRDIYYNDEQVVFGGAILERHKCYVKGYEDGPQFTITDGNNTIKKHLSNDGVRVIKDLLGDGLRNKM